MGSTVSSPIVVWGRAPAKIELGAFSLGDMICRSGQTSKVPNNCQAVSGVTARPSYCAGISSISYCSLSLLTKLPNPFCSSVQTLIRQKPNFQIPLQMPSPAQCRPAWGICLLRSPFAPTLCTSLCP